VGGAALELACIGTGLLRDAEYPVMMNKAAWHACQAGRGRAGEKSGFRGLLTIFYA
jgi:hypothetical protein